MLMLPSISRAEPIKAVVAMPSLRIKEADTTKTAVPNSVLTARFSTSLIFLSSPFKYSASALLDFNVLTHSRHSCIPSAHCIFADICLSLSFF